MSRNFGWLCDLVNNTNIDLILHSFCPRSLSPSCLLASLCVSNLPDVCIHVASGSKTLCEVVAGGVCDFGDQRSSRAADFEAEDSTYLGTESKGE